MLVILNDVTRVYDVRYYSFLLSSQIRRGLSLASGPTLEQPFSGAVLLADVSPISILEILIRKQLKLNQKWI